MALVHTALRPLKPLAYRTLLAKRRMAFPTFDQGLHADLAGRQDYFRHATLALALERIHTEAVPGALAEVGVYRGELSRLLHAVRPDRPLHLFDTFEGFPEDQLERFQLQDPRFRDTSPEQIRAALGHHPNIHIHEGLVPDTLADVREEQFAFVLLDLDLFEPSRASLEFFYPRLSPGAYLVIHDYNSPESNWACKRAFDGFLQDKPEPVVELADVWGTALIRKARPL